ncbi:scyllo-inositol 2-dehydrogenase (NADP(+)) IolW [Anaerolineae bacterium]|nr:scyllo-inositol 2-dehydrogenase (NADP(+)) IolW [Anaerolineae bacterium]
MNHTPTIRFSAIGINHNHIYGQVRLLLRAGAEFVSFYATEPDLLAEFAQAFPQARLASSAQEILEDETIQLVASSAIACERAPLGIQVMKHDKDFMSDKPGFTTLEQLAQARRVQTETKRIYSICFSERLEVRAAVQAGELIQAGAIGKVVQTVGLGPHRINPPVRPNWFYQRAKYGGILTDIASHQVDQFLFFTGSTQAEVVSSQVGNINHPQFPELEDFGDMVLRSDQGTGYIRVDWFTPQGLGIWGDGRLTILGTEGYIELRKYIDLAGRAGADHLFLVDQKGIHYLDCSQHDLPYGHQLIADVLNRTETAMPQTHCFLASQLALEAEAKAQKLGYLRKE